jgi:hypothetical protein
MSIGQQTNQGDERGTIEKLAAGDVSALKPVDNVNIAQGAAMAAGALGTHILPISIATTALSGAGDALSAEEEKKKLALQFCKSSTRITLQNPAVKHKLKDLDDRWQGTMLSSIVSMGCGAAAGAAVCTFIPIIPFGFMVGSIAGGVGGGYFYDNVCKKQAQDPVVINQQIIQMREAGQEVPAEVLFAALAANCSGKAGEKIDKICKQYTGKELFTEALADPKNMEKLTAMMNVPTVDNIIRGQTHMPPDEQNPSKTVAVQYAELLNSGKLEPQALLSIGAGLYASLPPEKTVNANVASASPEVPITPQLAQKVPIRTT